MLKKYLPILVLLFFSGVLLLFKTGKIKNPFTKKTSLITIQKDKLIEIEIIKDKKKTILTKKDGKWVVKTEGNFPAKTDGLEDFFKGIEELINPSLVSVNPKKHQIYEVDEKKGVKVIFKEKDGKTQELILGKIAPSGYEFYLRKGKDNNVYLVDMSLKIFFDNSDFRDLTIFKLESDKVKKITFKNINEEFSLEKRKTKDKKETKWFLDDKEVDQDKVSNFLTTISTVVAKDGFIEKSNKETGLENPQFSLIIETENLPKIELLVGGKLSFEENPDYYCTLKNSPIIFVISSTTLSDLRKTKSDFITDSE